MGTAVSSVAVRVEIDGASPAPQEYGSFEQTCGDLYVSGIMNTSTSAAAIPLGKVTTPGLFIGKNLDDTNTIYVRNGSGGTNYQEIGPGEPFQYKIANSIVPYAVSSAGTPKLEYAIYQKS